MPGLKQNFDTDTNSLIIYYGIGCIQMTNTLAYLVKPCISNKCSDFCFIIHITLLLHVMIYVAVSLS